MLWFKVDVIWVTQKRQEIDIISVSASPCVGSPALINLLEGGEEDKWNAPSLFNIPMSCIFLKYSYRFGEWALEDEYQAFIRKHLRFDHHLTDLILTFP